MTDLPYFMVMPTCTTDDVQAIRHMSTEDLRAALSASDIARGNPLALAEAHAELALRERVEG